MHREKPTQAIYHGEKKTHHIKKEEVKRNNLSKKKEGKKKKERKVNEKCMEKRGSEGKRHMQNANDNI